MFSLGKKGKERKVIFEKESLTTNINFPDIYYL